MTKMCGNVLRNVDEKVKLSEGSIGIASSIAADYNWDAMYALKYCAENGIGLCQLYAGQQFYDSMDEVIKAREFAYENNIALILHADKDLDAGYSSLRLRKIACGLLAYQEKKILVTHHKFGITQDEVQEAIASVRRDGIIPAVENFYPADVDAKKVFREYVDMIPFYEQSGAMAVFDIPRLYNSKVINDGLEADSWKRVFEGFNRSKIPFFYHLIDCTNTVQKREDWCNLGEGIVPYAEIAAFTLKLGIKADFTILEYENTDFLTESTAFLLKSGL